MPRISEEEQARQLAELRDLCEALCRDEGAPVPAKTMRDKLNVSYSTLSGRLDAAVKRGLLRVSAGQVYSPAVASDGRPMFWALVTAPKN